MSDNNDNNVISESVLSFHSQILFYHTKDGNPIGGAKQKPKQNLWFTCVKKECVVKYVGL